MTGLSRATESVTSDVLSQRHVNLVRCRDDRKISAPNIATGWAWDDDDTRLTFMLRLEHKWSDGAPLTAEDMEALVQ